MDWTRFANPRGELVDLAAPLEHDSWMTFDPEGDPETFALRKGDIPLRAAEMWAERWYTSSHVVVGSAGVVVTGIPRYGGSKEKVETVVEVKMRPKATFVVRNRT